MKRIYTLLMALALTLCMTVPALGAYNGVYVYDPDGILTETDAELLETQAAKLTDAYDCAVYLFTVADFTTYGYEDIFDFAQDYYEENLLGCGEDRDGILLTLSTETRDVSLAVYGPWAQTAFTDYGQDCLYDAFLTEFGNSDWYTGAAHYLSTCGDLLYEARNGAPVDVTVSYDGYVYDDEYTETSIAKTAAMCFLPAVVIAFIVCGMMKKKMKTARKASGASAYVTGSVDLKVCTDRYTHSTVVRKPINTNNGPKGGGHRGGGTRVNSRGFSGGSRKF